MKFCATYRVPHGNWRQVLQTFSSLTPEERADVGEEVVLIGRWHDMSSRSGVVILESDDAAAVQRFIGRWNALWMSISRRCWRTRRRQWSRSRFLADHEAR